MLAARPVLFTAHYRRVVPAHNTPNNISREHQPIRHSDYELLHISAVVGNSLQPCFLFAVLNFSPRNQSLFLTLKSGSSFQYCITRRSNPFTSFTGRHYVPPFNLKLCSFYSLVVLWGIRVLKRCWLQVQRYLRLTIAAWCPLIIRQTILVVNFSKFGAAIMSFCTSAPSRVIPYNPVFYLQC